MLMKVGNKGQPPPYSTFCSLLTSTHSHCKSFSFPIHSVINSHLLPHLFSDRASIPINAYIEAEHVAIGLGSFQMAWVERLIPKAGPD